MSWYIEYLLRNADDIREQAYTGVRDDRQTSAGWYEPVSEPEYSDAFNDLLILEVELRKLQEDGSLDEKQMKLVKLLMAGHIYEDISKELGITRFVIADRVANLTKILDFKTKGVFSNDAIIFELKTKYNLTEEQVENVRNYMQSNFRNKIIRKRK